MTFDEAQNLLLEQGLDDEIAPLVIYVMGTLKDTYVPTVEMTKSQYNFIATDYEQENIVDAVANLSVDNILRENFHTSFWYPLTQREVVQAWLHPETIKIVDK